ncbi:MAG: S26 family signal peptidase [Acidimicrobiales bacterium]
MPSPYPWAGRGRSAGRALAALAVGFAALSWARRVRPVFRVSVEGTSMIPELAPGDRLLAVKLPVLEAGDIVALTDPAEPSRILVKRVTRLHAVTVEVEGDNGAVSRDSRVFGAVSRRQVLGRVVYRYHPREAAGRLGRR